MMGLPDDEMQKLTSSVTHRIPERSCPLRLQLASKSASAHCLQAAALQCQSTVRLRSLVQA
jgi:hypothetical protein